MEQQLIIISGREFIVSPLLRKGNKDAKYRGEPEVKVSRINMVAVDGEKITKENVKMVSKYLKTEGFYQEFFEEENNKGMSL